MALELLLERRKKRLIGVRITGKLGHNFKDKFRTLRKLLTVIQVAAVCRPDIPVCKNTDKPRAVRIVIQRNGARCVVFRSAIAFKLLAVTFGEHNASLHSATLNSASLLDSWFRNLLDHFAPAEPSSADLPCSIKKRELRLGCATRDRELALKCALSQTLEQLDACTA